MTFDVKNTVIIKSDGRKESLGEYAGYVLLIVNVNRNKLKNCGHRQLQNLNSLLPE